LTNQIRILVVDDHALFLEGVERLLSNQQGFVVVGSCTSAAEALCLVQTQLPDIVLLDYDLGNEHGLRLLEELRRNDSLVPVLFITAGVGDSQVRRILQLPPSGIILKHKPSELLVQAIRAILSGETWLDSKLVLPLVNQEPRNSIAKDPQLTARERDVLRGVFEGNHNKAIASQLQVSESAVKAILQQLFDKTGVRSRTQLLRLALEKHAADWLGIVPQE
jgi:DNA-binding NarL/FixJ family response regulator